MAGHDENWVKRKLKKMLDELGAYHYPASAGSYSVGGIPDRIGCYKGRFFGIEAKRPGRRGEENRGLSALQYRTGQSIEKAGGLFFVVDGPEDIAAVKEALEAL